MPKRRLTWSILISVVSLGALVWALWSTKGSGLALVSDDAVAWSLTRVGPQLEGVAYGRDQFIAVGRDGAILSSTSGTDWVRRPTPVRESLRGIAFGAGRFVAVGDQGRILVSPQGTTWSQSAAGSDQDLTAVAYGNGSFVAVGRGLVATSADGEHWVARDTPFSLTGVAYGDGRFVAIGDEKSQKGVVLTSTDLLVWKEVAFGRSTWQGVAYGSGQFVVGGYDGQILTSSDGENWTQHDQAAGFLYRVTYGNGLFTAVGSRIIWRSPDGSSWTQSPTATRSVLRGVAFGGGRWVVVGIQDTWIH